MESKSALKSAALFQLMAKQDLSKFVEKVKGVFHFQVKASKSAAPETFTLDLKSGPGSLTVGKVGTADCTFLLLDSHLMDMATGKLKPQNAFIQGKMKIKGDMKMAMKFTPDMLPKMPKL